MGVMPLALPSRRVWRLPHKIARLMGIFINSNGEQRAGSEWLRVKSGGVLNAVFAPTDIAGLKLWLKADAQVYKDAGVTLAADGDTVQQWSDQSGNANDATQATLANRPVYKSNILNSKPIIRFPAGVISLVCNASPGVIKTVIVVVTNLVSGTTAPSVMEASDTYRVVTFYPDKNTLYSGDGNEYFGTSFTNYVNGVATSAFGTKGIVSQVATGSPPNPSTWRIAVSTPFGSGRQFLGDIAEILSYDSVLSSTNRQLVETYLNGRWAIY